MSELKTVLAYTAGFASCAALLMFSCSQGPTSADAAEQDPEPSLEGRFYTVEVKTETGGLGYGRAEVSCRPGDQVISGGCGSRFNSVDIMLQESFPKRLFDNSDAWFCSYKNNHPNNIATITTSVFCLDMTP